MSTSENKPTALRPTVRQGGALPALFPIMVTVFLAFLVIGTAMPVLLPSRASSSQMV